MPSPAAQPDRTPVPTRVGIAIIDSCGYLLVTRRRKDSHLGGYLEFPGGKCLLGEAPADCAVRECREELGVDVRILEELPPVFHTYADRSIGLHPYRCRIVRGIPQPRQSQSLEWVLKTRLEEGDFPVANGTLLRVLRVETSLPVLPKRALLFDLDGTLVDTQEDIATAGNLTRNAIGLPPLDPRHIATMIGAGLRPFLTRLLPPPCQVDMEEAVRLFRGFYHAHLLEETRPYPGIRECLMRLGDRPLAVVSNKPEGFSRKILEGLGLAHHFKLVLGGDSCPEPKPNPAPIHRAIELLGIDPADVSLIGDSEIDSEAARRAGVAFCAVSYGLTSRDVLLALHPDRLAESGEALGAILLE